MTTEAKDEVQTVRLAFCITCPDPATRQKVCDRLQVDYSARDNVTIEGGGPDTEWFVASLPIFVGEFGSMVRYVPTLVKLFGAGSELTIIPAYISQMQMVISSPPDDTRSILIGTNAHARLALYIADDGEVTEVDSPFCQATGARELFDQVHAVAGRVSCG